MSVSFASPASHTCRVYDRSYKLVNQLESLNELWQERAVQSESYLIVLVGDGGPAGQAGHDLGWEHVLALAGDWDDAVLFGVSRCKMSFHFKRLDTAGAGD